MSSDSECGASDEARLTHRPRRRIRWSVHMMGVMHPSQRGSTYHEEVKNESPGDGDGSLFEEMEMTMRKQQRQQAGCRPLTRM